MLSLRFLLRSLLVLGLVAVLGAPSFAQSMMMPGHGTILEKDKKGDPPRPKPQPGPRDGGDGD